MTIFEQNQQQFAALCGQLGVGTDEGALVALARQSEASMGDVNAWSIVEALGVVADSEWHYARGFTRQGILLARRAAHWIAAVRGIYVEGRRYSNYIGRAGIVPRGRGQETTEEERQMSDADLAAMPYSV